MSATVFLVHFFTLLIGARPLVLREVVVPPKVLAGLSTTLSCLVDLNDDIILESLKWYKDDAELCAFSPTRSVQQRPLAQAFNKLEEVKCGNSSLEMVPVSAAASGTYKCVATALKKRSTTKQTTVQTVMASRNLSVFAYPMDPPLISGLKSVYRPGDYIEASCAAPPSYPPAQLYWTLNEAEVNQHQTYSRAEDERGLLRSIIGLKIMADSSFFNRNPDGYALLVCTSVLVDSSPLSTSKKIYYSSKLNPQIEEEDHPDRKRHAPQSKGSNKAVHLVSISITLFSLVCHFAS